MSLAVLVKAGALAINWPWIMRFTGEVPSVSLVARELHVGLGDLDALGYGDEIPQADKLGVGSR